MRNPIQTIEKYGKYRFLAIIGSVLVNVLLAYLVSCFGWPLYLDALGTVFVALLLGTLPGILTAIATNLLCCIFYPDAVYYAFISVLLVLGTTWFVKRDKQKKKRNVLLLIILLSLIGGGLGIVFQWLLLGEPQFGHVADTAKVISSHTGASYFVSAMILMIGLNLVDKGLSVMAALACFHAIPEDTRQSMRNSSWKQKPLTNSEIKMILSDKKTKKRSLKGRVTYMLVTAAVAISLILGWVSTRMSYEDAKENGRRTVVNATTFAASFLKPDCFEKFLKEKKKIAEYEDPDYTEMNNLLLSLQHSFSELEYVYVYQIREDGCHVIFDTDEVSQKEAVIDECVAFDESYLGLVPTLLAGGRIDVQESESRYGYFITAYEPLYDEDGQCVAYVGADISLNNFSTYIRHFIIRMILVFSGFFVLILAYGFSLSDHYLVYPISSLENSIDGFMQGIDDQEQLDESVKKLQKLDIRTGDEVERLYRSVCEMALGTAEQMSSIRMLAKSNEKMQNGLIITMADMVENRDSDTGAHIQKTAAYVRIILDGLKRKGYYTDKLTEKYMNDVELSAPLHDIGKIHVPDAVLNKPGKLTAEEFEIMKTHTTAGKKILENAISTVEGENYLKEARNMAAYHHERWDGKGYPEGLREQVIPLSARVMAVADVFDALASPRVYKPAFPLEKALAILQEGSGTQFDPKCVEVFMDSLDEVKKILKKYQES